jgi:hypothetical protein
LEVAAEAATSPRAVELAQAAGNRRGAPPPERPLSN